MDSIQQHFKIANNALSALEKVIRKQKDTPSENIEIDKFQLINIPDNYVRRAAYFRKEYRLRELISNNNQIDNIAYSLQMSDLYNYYINRFNIYGVLRNLIIKQAIVNLFSVHEGILYSTSMSLNIYCINDEKTCKKAHKCPVYVNKRSKLDFNKLLELYKNKLGFYHPLLFEHLRNLKEIRDNIHLEDVKFSEWIANEKYSLDKLNSAIVILRFIKLYLHKCVAEFKDKREKGCLLKI